MASNFLLQEAVSAYYAMYEQNIQEDLLWEALLTEEFVTEAYQTVADYLVYNNFVPGYQTAECYMAEMALEDIDNILFETGVLDEQYLIEAGFFQNLGAGADRFVAGARRNVSNAANAVRGTAQRAGQAVAGGVQRAGQAVAGTAQRAGQAVARAATPVAQAVQGTAQRAVAAGQSALQGAGRAAVGAGQAVVGTAQRAGQAVSGGAQRVGQTVAGGVQRAGQAVAGAAGAVGGAAAAAGRRIGQEIEISRRVGAGEPIGGTAKQQPQSQSPTTPAPSRFGTTTPRGSSVTSTGVSGLSPTDRAAYSAGGGNAAAQRGMGQTTSQVIAQGRTNLGRMNQSAPAPAGAKPTSGGSSTNPKSGLSAYPAATTQRATSAAPAASGSVSPARPSAPAPTSAPTTQTTATPAAKKPSLASQAAELRAMQTASRQRQGLTQSFDMFDVVMGHLLGEGYVETEEQALAIMANMSEEWRDSIMIAEGMTMKDFKANRQKNKRRAASADAEKRGHVGKEWYNSGRKYSPDEAKRMRSKLDDEERRTRHRSAVEPDNENDDDFSADKTKNPKKLRKQKAMGELG